ncbi:MAG: FtsQ-type POTRA domain-containing protein [Acidimicrobiales bacterium]|nr:FtsQ-type POTRA domain-containing protein [Acidimicrobiales bacterium]
MAGSRNSKKTLNTIPNKFQRKTSSRSKVAIHPKIKERRIEVIRDQGRKRLRRFSVLLATLAFIGILSAIFFSPITAANSVNISGNYHESKTQILSLTGLDSKPQLISINSQALVQEIDALPWVNTSQVEKVWPDSINVKVVERNPVAYLTIGSQAGSYAIVDNNGRVLGVSSTKPANLVELFAQGKIGPPGSFLSPSLLGALDAITLLPSSMKEMTNYVQINGSGDIIIALNPFGSIDLGAGSDLGSKIATAAAIVSQVPLTAGQTVDVSVPESPVISSGNNKNTSTKVG